MTDLSAETIQSILAQALNRFKKTDRHHQVVSALEYICARLDDYVEVNKAVEDENSEPELDIPEDSISFENGQIVVDPSSPEWMKEAADRFNWQSRGMSSDARIQCFIWYLAGVQSQQRKWTERATTRGGHDVLDERNSQKSRWGNDHDDQHGEAHLIHECLRRLHSKLVPTRQDLVESSALLIAAIDVIDRREAQRTDSRKRVAGPAPDAVVHGDGSVTITPGSVLDAAAAQPSSAWLQHQKRGGVIRRVDGVMGRIDGN